jgi:Na+-transporting NADH:ubiquinone oxidoreductase subunit C
MPDAGAKKTFLVALAVCIVCSILVSAPAVTLKKKQDANKRLDKIKNILEAAGLLQDNANIEAVYNEKVVPAIIDLTTGQELPKTQYTETLNPEKFDVKTLLKDPAHSLALTQDKDKAHIKTMPKWMLVYYVKEGAQIEKVVFPIYGKGLYGTLYGVIALGRDLKTVQGLTFYEHGETPGLGGEVDNPRWKNQWKGKAIFDDKGEVRLTVNKQGLTVSNLDPKFQIDGLSGATMTTRGVNNLVQFWMGRDGYGTFIQTLRKTLSS